MTKSAPTLTPELAEQLEQLRDIHLPPDISWWPLAPGWWALAGVVALLVLAVVAVTFVRHRTVRYRALGELEDLRRNECLNSLAAAECVAILLKRIVRQRDNTRSHSVEHSTRWAERLMQDAGGMPAEIARFIALAPYASAGLIESEPDRAALFAAADRWIRRNA